MNLSLYQALDEFGFPKFSSETGRPVFALKAHDVEEFEGVVSRYGAEASGVKEMVLAANKGQSIAAAKSTVYAVQVQKGLHDQNSY